MTAAVDSMAFVGEVPWHKLGTRVTSEDDMYDWEQFSKHAGLDWSVKKEPLVTMSYAKDIAVKSQVDTYAIDDLEHNTSAYATIREDNNTILGTVGAGYRVLQNNEAFKFFQSWLDTKEVALHTAGSLYDGKKVWVLAQITKDYLTDIVPGDSICKFLLLSNGHDGMTSVRVGFSPTRVVCANTLSMAHTSGRLIRLIHSRQVQNNLSEIKETINLINQEFETTAKKYRYLTERDINTADLEKYIKIVLNVKDDKKLSTRQSNIIQDVTNLMDAPNQKIPGISGTYWAAFNAVNTYFNHKYGHNDNSRMNNMWFGKGDNNALKTALQLAG